MAKQRDAGPGHAAEIDDEPEVVAAPRPWWRTAGDVALLLLVPAVLIAVVLGLVWANGWTPPPDGGCSPIHQALGHC